MISSTGVKFMPLRRLLTSLVVVSGAFISASCDDGGSNANQQSTNQQKSSQQSTVAPSQNAPGKTVSETKTWPYITENVETLSDGEKLRKNYMLVLDGSGSMKEAACKDKTKSKSVVSKMAGKTFVDRVPAEENVGLITFDGRGIAMRVALGTRNRDVLKREIDATNPDSGTPLGESTEIGYKALTKQAQRQLGYGEYHIVLITDGEASDSRLLDRVVREVLSESPVVVHVVGFCLGNTHSLNQPGRTIYKEAGNLQELVQGLDSVLAESPDFSVQDFKRD